MHAFIQFLFVRNTPSACVLCDGPSGWGSSTEELPHSWYIRTMKQELKNTGVVQDRAFCCVQAVWPYSPPLNFPFMETPLTRNDVCSWCLTWLLFHCPELPHHSKVYCFIFFTDLCTYTRTIYGYPSILNDVQCSRSLSAKQTLHSYRVLYGIHTHACTIHTCFQVNYTLFCRESLVG